MYYNKLLGLDVSALGMGTMRLPVKENGTIDDERAEEIIDFAYEKGVNYFDTAYKYHNGLSESFLGKVLKKYPRNTWYIATKMPGHMMRKVNGGVAFRGYMRNERIKSIHKIFEEQLEKCQVDYFDFYLCHNVNDISASLYMDEEIGIIKFLMDQKRKGKIRHLGFSTHGSIKVIESFITKYDCFEFCQIQLNYFDWFQGMAKEQYDLLCKYNYPIVVMEPCHGGKLANLSKYNRKELTENGKSDASYAFKFLQNFSNVKVILSGMSSLDQLEDNLNTFKNKTGLTTREQISLEKISKNMQGLVMCTGCSYCCDSCIGNVDIPNVLDFYNKYVGNSLIKSEKNLAYLDEINKCKNCGLCEKACPQGIKIRSLFDFLKVKYRESRIERI